MLDRTMRLPGGRFTIFFEDGAFSMPTTRKHAKAAVTLFGGDFRPLYPTVLDRVEAQLPIIRGWLWRICLPTAALGGAGWILGYHLPRMLYAAWF